MTNMECEMLTEIGQAAVGYAKRGWHVCPVRADTKGRDANNGSTHYLQNGMNDASCDPQQVRTWWMQWPDANIALNLAASGLLALDPDTYKPDCDWDAFIIDKHLPVTLVQRSARGGHHYIFAAPQDAAFPARSVMVSI